MDRLYACIFDSVNFAFDHYFNALVPVNGHGNHDAPLLPLPSLVMLFKNLLSLFLVSAAAGAFPTATDYMGNAQQGLHALQDWYNDDTGLWNSTGWWNAANCLTVLANFAELDDSVLFQAAPIFANTFTQAQCTNLQMTKIITDDFNIQSFYGISALEFDSLSLSSTPNGFLNHFYDDEGWWALGWVQVYDVTGNEDYLRMAADIFHDMKNGSTTPCGGGIWWNKKQTYVNAIANELYLSVAAHLANRIPDQQQFYADIATSQWSWFQNTGMINSKSLINDGLKHDCTPNNGTVWSYNQGVILGALVELNKASPNASYLQSARSIATAAIDALSDKKGILHDPCEPKCGGDGTQFKGIFMRNLQLLHQAAPDRKFLNFISNNAASIVKHNTNSNHQSSVNWSGPFVEAANASTQSSALDALVAAVAFIGGGIAPA